MIAKDRFKENWIPQRIADCCRDLVDVYRGPKTFGISEILLVSHSAIPIKTIKAEFFLNDINSPISFRQLDKLTNVPR